MKQGLSVIIPARNEAGNIPRLIAEMPVICPMMELIFVEGHSQDGTWETLQKEIAAYKGPMRITAVKQQNIGKWDAVIEGGRMAQYSISCIFDADITVSFDAIQAAYDKCMSEEADMVIGNRFHFKMQKGAMRPLNWIGNRGFAVLVSLLCGSWIPDTLCGLKAFRTSDFCNLYCKSTYAKIDPFGDFALIFAAKSHNKVIASVPTLYFSRTYGSTNISRFRDAFRLLHVCLRYIQCRLFYE